MNQRRTALSMAKLFRMPRRRALPRAISGLAVVVPLYDEEDNVLPLVHEITAALQQLDMPIEIILVDDGSRDGTPARIREAGQRCASLRCVRLAHNQGQSAALVAGVRAARMSHVATMDGDLQNVPADLVAMRSLLDEVDVVIGRRAGRCDTLARRAGAWIANSARRIVLRDGASDTGCALRLFPREAFLALPAFDGMHRFLPALFGYQGLRIGEIPVTHRERRSGRTKYTNLGRLGRTVFDLAGVVWLSRRTVQGAASTMAEQGRGAFCGESHASRPDALLPLPPTRA